MNRSLQVLAVEPFYGGSHQAFLDGVFRHSRHHWTLVRGPARRWKWRMRSAPLALAAAADEAIAAAGAAPDVVWCSDMLDLPQWRGMRPRARWAQAPASVYFHENQWTYPQSPAARVDSHFGYTNLLTALAADACYFNSRFHRDEFLAASKAFVRRMPDSRSAHDFEALRHRCQVIPPGFDPPAELAGAASAVPPRRRPGPLRLGWVSRWEFDKRPDRLLRLLEQLQQRAVAAELILLGQRPKAVPKSLARLRQDFAGQIIHDGFAASREDYWRLLQSIDVVVSTADHEFFGIAVCEAIWAGAVPLLPNRLSYPELVPAEFRYGSLDQAVEKIAHWADSDWADSDWADSDWADSDWADSDWADSDRHHQLSRRSREAIQPLQMVHTVGRLDAALDELADANTDAGT